MTNLTTWKQIDTNGNGYLDGNEVTKAKKKNIKNVWINMTENDYKTGITRQGKLDEIINDYGYGLPEVSVTEIMIGFTDEESQKIKSERKKILLERKKAIEEKLILLDRKAKQNIEQGRDYQNEYDAELDKLPSGFLDKLSEYYYNLKFSFKLYFYDPNKTIDKSFQAPTIGEQREEYVQSSLGSERVKRMQTRQDVKNKYKSLINSNTKTYLNIAADITALIEEYKVLLEQLQ